MEDFQAGIIKTGVFFSISDCWLRKYSGFLFLNQIYQKLCHILCQIGSQKSHMPFPCILKVGIFLHFRQRRLQIFRACREQIGFYDQLIRSGDVWNHPRVLVWIPISASCSRRVRSSSKRYCICFWSRTGKIYRLESRAIPPPSNV